MSRELVSRVFSTRCDWAVTVLRVVVGVVFIVHGWDKIQMGPEKVAGFFGGAGIPLPVLSAHLAMWTEFLGGVALVLGAATRLVSIPLAFTMVVAFAFVHAKGGFKLPSGFEYVLVLFATLMVLLRNGAGALGVDVLLARGLARPGGSEPAIPS